MERPAIRRLLADVQAKKVDCVLVYKVDRLSRSIRDFAKIMEILEKHGTTFVSVTQQFNTTTSLGRLTLNILLSFAQFEREIISERTRDKQVLATALRTNRLCSGGTRKAVSLNQSTASASALSRRSTVGSRPDFCGTLMHLPTGSGGAERIGSMAKPQGGQRVQAGGLQGFIAQSEQDRFQSLGIYTRRIPHHSGQLRLLKARHLECEIVPAQASIDGLAEAAAVGENQRAVGEGGCF